MKKAAKKTNKRASKFERLGFDFNRQTESVRQEITDHIAEAEVRFEQRLAELERRVTFIEDNALAVSTSNHPKLVASEHPDISTRVIRVPGRLA